MILFGSSYWSRLAPFSPAWYLLSVILKGQSGAWVCSQTKAARLLKISIWIACPADAQVACRYLGTASKLFTANRSEYVNRTTTMIFISTLPYGTMTLHNYFNDLLTTSGRLILAEILSPASSSPNLYLFSHHDIIDNIMQYLDSNTIESRSRYPPST